MTVIALVSAGGAPGVTTAALALTVYWPQPALLVECDPDGGDVAAGYFGGHIRADHGLMQVALRAQTGDRPSTAITDESVALNTAGTRRVLLGPRDPFQAQAITTDGWERIGRLLEAAATTMIIDLGEVRAAPFPFPILDVAALIVLVLRPTARQIVRARPRIDKIREALGPGAPIGLCVIDAGPYTVRYTVGEVRALLGDLAVVVGLPHDPKAAARLSDGYDYRGDLRASDLLRDAVAAARALHDHVRHRRGPVRGDVDLGGLV